MFFPFLAGGAQVYANAAADLGFAIKFLMSSALYLAGNDGVVTTGHWLCWVSRAHRKAFVASHDCGARG